MALIGYMRVSTKKQDTQLQEDALLRAGVLPGDIYRDVMSGKTTTRAGLDNCLARLGSGDVLVVWKLDRVGRTVIHLHTLVRDLQGRGIGFRSLTEAFDTCTVAGRAMFGMMCVFAEMERNLAQERIKAGIAAVMGAGRQTWGRPPKSPYDPLRLSEMSRAGMSVREIARAADVSATTVQRALARGRPGPECPVMPSPAVPD